MRFKLVYIKFKPKFAYYLYDSKDRTRTASMSAIPVLFGLGFIEKQYHLPDSYIVLREGETLEEISYQIPEEFI